MISYEPLVKTLEKRGMKRTDLLPYMSSATLAKIRNNKSLNTKTLNTICSVLHCKIEDVIVYIEES